MKRQLVAQPDGKYAMLHSDTTDFSSYMMEREEAQWWLEKGGMSKKDAERYIQDLRDNLIPFTDDDGKPLDSWSYALYQIEKAHGKEKVEETIDEMKFFYGFRERSRLKSCIIAAKVVHKNLLRLKPVVHALAFVIMIPLKAMAFPIKVLWKRRQSRKPRRPLTLNERFRASATLT